MTLDVEKQFVIAIAKSGGRKRVALLMEMDETELSRKLSGVRGWKIRELQQFCEITGMQVTSEGNGKCSEQDGDFGLVLELSKKLTRTMEELKEIKSAMKKAENGDKGSMVERKGE